MLRSSEANERHGTSLGKLASLRPFGSRDFKAGCHEYEAACFPKFLIGMRAFRCLTLILRSSHQIPKLAHHISTDSPSVLNPELTIDLPVHVIIATLQRYFLSDPSTLALLKSHSLSERSFRHAADSVRQDRAVSPTRGPPGSYR